MPSLANWLSQVFAWRSIGEEEGRRLVWKRVAYATRYGKGCSLVEALNLDNHALSGYLGALGELVREENEANKPRR